MNVKNKLVLLFTAFLLSGCAKFAASSIEETALKSADSGSPTLLLKQEYVAANTFEVSTDSDVVRSMSLYLDGQTIPVSQITAPPFSYRINTANLIVGYHVLRAELDISLFGTISKVDRVIVFLVNADSGSPPSTFAVKNVRSSTVTKNSAQIDWDLTDFGTGQVEYGTSSTLLNQKTTPELSLNFKSHKQSLANLIPGTMYYFRVTSKNASGISESSGVYSFRTEAEAVGSLPTPTSSGWQVSYSPPQLIQPKMIRIPADVQPIAWPAYNGHCAGQIYSINIPKDQDAVIVQSGDMPLDKPVWINGGRNVRVIGLDFSFKTQPGCNDGVLKIPGGIALRVEQSDTSFIEGLKMDLTGHVTDCIVARNFNISAAEALAKRNIYIQNSACRGGVGTYPGSPYGDYLHADFFQNQGHQTEPLNRIVFENISQQTTATGVVLDGQINETIVLNYEYALDRRYPNDLHVLNSLWLRGDKITFKNIYTEFGENFATTGNMPMSVRDNSAGVYYSYKALGVIKFSPEIFKGFPPQPFAPWDRIGLNYKSPHP